MNPKVIVKMNTLKMKVMHPLKNHQKHTSLPRQRLKKKGTQITEDLLDSNHYTDHNKDATDRLLETGVVITSKQIHEIYKDNIKGETLREMKL